MITGKRRYFCAMRKLFYAVLLVALASCVVSRYPIDLSYQAKSPKGAGKKGTVAVSLFNDKRDVAQKNVIGMKDDEARFVSLIEGPAPQVSDAFRSYLENRGYTVVRLNEAWDGTAESLKPQWGDMVVGGDIEDLNITVISAFPKTEYKCRVKLNVVIADPKTGAILQKQRVESSQSYVTVYFSRDKAEELINSTLAEAMEKALDKIDSYHPAG